MAVSVVDLVFLDADELLDLTIKDYNRITESYALGVPDEEVRRNLCALMIGGRLSDESLN